MAAGRNTASSNQMNLLVDLKQWPVGKGYNYCALHCAVPTRPFLDLADQDRLKQKKKLRLANDNTCTDETLVRGYMINAFPDKWILRWEYVQYSTSKRNCEQQ